MFDDDDFDINDFDFGELSKEENEEIKKEMENESKFVKSHPLIKQAKVIFEIIDALIDEDNEDSRFGGTLMESAIIIQAKLHGAIACKSYAICMENAAFVRHHANYILMSNHLLDDDETLDKQYIGILREEMEKFRDLFKIWAAEIHLLEKPDMDDEWGLFLK